MDVKFKKNDSVIVSWEFDGSVENGVVLIGRKDPLGIEQRIEIVDSKIGEEGLDILSKLGIEFE